jgi:4-amino-4-deoxy-L-arabinose transferase-like glycosyltransferase
LIALANPLWGMGAIIATPDIPLIFFWSLALYATYHLLQRGRLKDYLLLGLALGCGFLAKYHIALFLPPLFFLLVQQKAWHRFVSYKTILSVAVALLFCLPVFIWNAQNEWASIAFQWKHGLGASEHWKWVTPLNYLGGQLLIIFPPFLFFLFKGSSEYRKHWLFPFAAFPFVFFLYSSFKSHVEANWTLIGLPPLYYLAFVYTPENLFLWLKRSVVLWMTLLLLTLGLLQIPSVVRAVPNNLTKALKFQPLLAAIKPEQTYYAVNYQMAGYLSFKTDRLICKFPTFSRPDHFGYIEQCKGLPQSFHYIIESSTIPPVEYVFPYLKVESTQKIGDDFLIQKIVTK